MMKICYSLLVVSILLGFASCETDGPDDYKDHFIKYYGGDGDQESKDLLVNNDGTIVMLGTSMETTGKKNIYLIKADAQGKQLWSLKLVGPTNEAGQDVEKIAVGPDAGNYLIVSNAEKSVKDSLAIRLTIVSEAGDSLKSFLIDRYESQEAKSISILPSGQYYITGKVKNADTLNVELPGFDLEDSFDMTLSNDYLLVSSERTGGSTLASGIRVIEKANSINYALYSDELKVEPDTPLDPTDGLYEVNFVFRKFDKTSNSKVSFYAGSPRHNEYLTDIAPNNLGMYMAVGTQLDPSDNAHSKLYACTINSSYVKPLLNQGIIDGSPAQTQGVTVTAAAESGVFWVLANEIKTGGLRNIWVGKVDATDLTTVFSKTFGGSGNDDTGSKILQLDNGDILILGTMELVNQKKIALIKISANGSF